MDEKLIEEIDGFHKAANDALKEKRFSDYMDFFADDLQYKQLNGKVINKQQLTSDTRRYFDRIREFSGEFERMEITIDNNRIVERLIQHAKVSIRIFIFFSKRWIVEREGVYTLEKNKDKWKIIKVDIINEKVS
jgi:hypothetical protein